MLQQALARFILIVGCLSPSLLCFGLAGYIILRNPATAGWGWFLFIGTIALEVPARLAQLPEECPSCKARPARPQTPVAQEWP